jgi:hypothetical protein
MAAKVHDHTATLAMETRVAVDDNRQTTEPGQLQPDQDSGLRTPSTPPATRALAPGGVPSGPALNVKDGSSTWSPAARQGGGRSSRQHYGAGRASRREVSQAPTSTSAVPTSAAGATRSPRTTTPSAIATTGMK